jgi:hypothetical protein
LRSAPLSLQHTHNQASGLRSKPVSEDLKVRHEGNLWTCVCEDEKLEGVGLVDLIVRIQKELRVRKFSIEFDCDGKAIDGVIATFDFGAPDTYIPD